MRTLPISSWTFLTNASVSLSNDKDSLKCSMASTFYKHATASKTNCHTYINRFCEKYVDTWLGNMTTTKNRPILLLSCPVWLTKFNCAVGSSKQKDQLALAKSMQIKYRAGVGEIIWAVTTCRPDISFASVKISQSNSSPQTSLPRTQAYHQVSLCHTQQRHILLAHYTKLNSP